MKCPKCGAEDVQQMVNVMIQCPAGYRSLDKKGIRSKKVTVYAVDWAGATLVCHDCGWIHCGRSRLEAIDG